MNPAIHILAWVAIFVAGIAAGIRIDDGQKARDELVRQALQQKVNTVVRTVIQKAAAGLEAKKAAIDVEFVTITKEVDRDISANPDLYSRACFSPVGLRELNAAAGYGGDAGREPAPAVPAAATP